MRRRSLIRIGLVATLLSFALAGRVVKADDECWRCLGHPQHCTPVTTQGWTACGEPFGVCGAWGITCNPA